MGMGGQKSRPAPAAPAPAQPAPEPDVIERDYVSSQAAKNANAQTRASENSGAALLGSDAVKDEELLKRREGVGTA